MKDKGLIIFIKNSDNVKTRIAATKGKDAAINIYNELLVKVKELCKTLNDVDLQLYYSDEYEEIDDWSLYLNNKHRQIDGDLGKRMSAAFEDVLKYHKKAIIIGSDCPYIVKEDIDIAFASLDVADVAIGPANDGGYYMLGLKKIQANLFNEIEWSTNFVASKTIEKVFENGLSLYKHHFYSDIDTYDDYIQWKNNNK